nr:galactose-binding lectin [Quercus suber]
MHLWDKASRSLKDFTTHFSFVIDSLNQPDYADGLAFFLAPSDSKIPIGAMSNNEWDPPGEHAGIDINSIKSAANVSWLSNITIREGKRNEVWISYNSSSHNLSVEFTSLNNNVTVRQFLYYIVDLSLYLPEYVTFGFSAATGNASCAIHTISSWDFCSSLEIDNSITTPKGPNPALTPKRRNTFKLAMGFGFGGLIFVGGLVAILFAL